MRRAPRITTVSEAIDAAARIADGMADDLEETLREKPDLGPATSAQVINGYRMIARLIRKLENGPKRN